MSVVLELNKDLHWQSDWAGDEVGFDDVEIVGLYTMQLSTVELNLYIDMETMKILDAWTSEED